MGDITFTCVVLDSARADDLFSSFCDYFKDEIFADRLVLGYEVVESDDDDDTTITYIGDKGEEGSNNPHSPATFVLNIVLSDDEWQDGELSNILEKIKLVQTYPEHCFVDEHQLLETSGSFIGIGHMNKDEYFTEEVMQFLLTSHNTGIFQHHINDIRLRTLEHRLNQLIEINNQTVRAVSGIKVQQYNETKFAGILPELLREICQELGLSDLYIEKTTEILVEH